MDRSIASRCVRSTTDNLPNPNAITYLQSKCCADRIAVAHATDQSHSQESAERCRAILYQSMRFADACDDKVHASIAIEVCDGQTSPGLDALKIR